MIKDLAYTILEIFKINNPDISTAICGSVANNTYTDNSDIDLLFYNKNIDKMISIGFEINGILINIIMLNRKVVLSNYSTFLNKHDNMLFNYIMDAKKFHDPYENIKNFIDEIDEFYQRREMLSKLLVDSRITTIEESLNRKYDTEIEYKDICYEILENILSIWFIKNVNRVLSKEKSIKLLEFVKEKDEPLYNSIKECVPIHKKSLYILQKIVKQFKT